MRGGSHTPSLRDELTAGLVRESQMARTTATEYNLICGDVFLRQAHVALGVGGVVQVPVGDGRDGNPGFESVTVRHGVQGHGAAETPSAPAESTGVELRKHLQRLVERR